MIGKILSAIFKMVISLVNLLLSPIDTLITSSLPDLSTALQHINNFFDWVISIIGYAVDMSGLNSFSINLIILYFTFVLTSTLAISVVKIALKWYNTLKP